MSIIKKGLIRLTVILFLMSNVSCSAQEIGKTLIEIGEIGAAYAVLIWKAVPNATGYEIYSSAEEAASYTLLNSTSDLTYKDETLVPLTTAYYKVRTYREAEGKKVYGTYSKSIAVQTKALDSPELSTLGAYTTEVLLVWLAVPGTSGYQVYYSKIGDSELTLVCTTVLLSCSVPIVESQIYYFRIKSVLQTATQTYTSYFSPAIKVISKPIDNPEVHLWVHTNSVDVSWTAKPNVVGYEVYLGDSTVFIFSKMIFDVKTSSVKIAGLTTNTKYFIWVRSYAKIGNTKIYGEFMPMVKMAVTLPEETD